MELCANANGALRAAKMLRRLILALLTLCLAAPALALPAGCPPPVPAASASHAGHHQRDSAPTHDAAMAGHQCIGCIAPIAGAPSVGRVALAPSLTVQLPPPSVRQIEPGAPEPPPPRLS